MPNSKFQTAYRKKWAICLLTFAICHLPCLSGAHSQVSIEAFNHGVQLFNDKHFNEAIPLFTEALTEDPEFVEAYYARGASRYYVQSLDGALQDLNAVLRLKPDHLGARALRGAVHYEADRWDAAMDDFNAVLKINPDETQSLLGRAVILLKRQNVDEAKGDFLHFLAVSPDDPLAPKVRDLVASLPHGAPPVPQEQETRPPEHAARSTSKADINKLADGLLKHPLAESYGRKVLRGEKAEAVGDIQSVPDMPQDKRNSEAGVEIVEPR